ncbi:TPA: LuxR C-terminal-related transcriptional regulator [Streptococcus suis]
MIYCNPLFSVFSSLFFAKSLYISDRTLTNHIQNILEKLEVDSTLKAVIKAQKLGYIK